MKPDKSSRPRSRDRTGRKFELYHHARPAPERARRIPRSHVYSSAELCVVEHDHGRSAHESATHTPPAIHPEIWPQSRSGVAVNPRVEAEVARILAQMTLEDQVWPSHSEADVNSVTPDEVRQCRLGARCSMAAIPVRAAMTARWGRLGSITPTVFTDASMAAYGDRIAIPIIWGSDSVHGNANLIGATIFPHNIGLCATRNPELMERIGQITALETRVTGQEWTFGPTIAVVRDDRWGRTYEAYSEDPRIVAHMRAAIVRGIQGSPGDADFLRGPHILATVKHFLGDGGTMNGVDQGDNQHTEERAPRYFFAPGYPRAIEAGVQSLMPSYNSWHGEKMHGFEAMLTDVLRGRFGFNGFTIGDWNGHGQVHGCTPSELRRRVQCRPRHVHGAGQLAWTLCQHAGASAFG